MVFLAAMMFAVVLLLAVADGFSRADDCWTGGYCCEDSEHHSFESRLNGGYRDGGKGGFCGRTRCTLGIYGRPGIIIWLITSS